MSTSNPLGGNSSHGTASRGAASHGTASRGTASRGTASRGTASRGTASEGTAPGVADHSDDQRRLEARHDATRHDAISPRQVAPIPHVEIEQEHLDVMELVREAIHDHPGAGADEIVRLLAEKQVRVSPTLVLQQLAGSGAGQTASSIARPPAAERS